MEDKKIREMFSEFNPPLSSNIQFMSRLREGLDSVEIVKAHNLEQSRHNRQSITVALVVGFLCGLTFSFFLPALSGALQSLQLGLPSGSLLTAIADYNFPLSLTIVAFATLFISLNAYELSLFLFRRSPR